MKLISRSFVNSSPRVRVERKVSHLYFSLLLSCIHVNFCSYVMVTLFYTSIIAPDLRLELAHQKGRAMDARELKQNVEFTKEATVDDLTRGIINYKFLGLDFEKADNNELRCVDMDLLDTFSPSNLDRE